jgi:CheY-like chemotaxis protein
MTLSILVVDDDMIIRQVVTRHLSLLGHLVDAASNGIEVLATMDKKTLRYRG